MKKEFWKMLATSIAETGFRPRAAGFYTYDIDDQWTGWLGMNYGSLRDGLGSVDLVPVVGIRSTTIERLVAEGTGVRYHSYNPPSYTDTLAHLSGVVSAGRWRLVSGRSDAPAILAEINDLLLNQGIPFICKNANYASIAELLQNERKGLFQYEYRWPIAEWKSKGTDAGLEALASLRNEYSGIEQLAIKKLFEFVDWLEIRIRSESTTAPGSQTG